MNRLLVGVFLVLLCASLFAAETSISLSRSQTEIMVNESNVNGISFHYDLSRISSFEVSTKRGSYNEISIPQFTYTSEIGQPKLPLNRQLIAVPLGAEVKVSVADFDLTEYNLFDFNILNQIIPRQASVRKCDDPADLPFEISEEAYAKAEFDQNPIATAHEIGIYRGVRIFAVDVTPVKYNPTDNTILVYNNLDVDVDFVGGDLFATEELRAKTFSPGFESVYNRFIVNHRDFASRENLTRYPIKFMVISDPMFEDQLQPFIEWKTIQGYEMIVAYTDDANVGTSTTSIGNYIESVWDAATENDPAPTYLLFVGDVAQIPAFNGSTGSHITDLNYVKLEGNDFMPEMYYSRFSANNTDELQPQIDKTLMYEKFEMEDPSYLSEVTMIAGMDSGHGASHGNGQINYGTTNYFNLAHGITSHTYLYPESGNNSNQIINDVSNGVGYINYTAHGYDQEWSDPEFTNSDLAQLGNSEMYCFAVGNCCLTNKFQVNTCFGEQWLRVEDKGGIGYIGGTNSTYWDEDYYWGVGYHTGPINGTPPSVENSGIGVYDGLFHEHGESFTEWYTTAASIISCGNLAVEQSNGSSTYYWEIYSLMGEPSLSPYLGFPEENIVTAPDVIFIGLEEFEILAAPYSYVALSMDGVLYGTALADETGAATLTFPAFTTPGMAKLVITAQNHQPYIADLEVIPNDGPYVVVNATTVNSGDDNVIAFGETASMDITLENVGTVNAENTNITLSINDDYITLTDADEVFGTINAESTTSLSDVVTFTVANDVPNNYSFTFDVLITSGDDSWVSSLSFMAFAPVVGIDNIQITNDDDGNGRLDPGETADIIVTFQNDGGAHANNIVTEISENDDLLTLNNTSTNIAMIEAGYAAQTTYNVTASADAGIGHVVDFDLELNGDNEFSVELDFALTIGLCFEDFETGDFTAYEWENGGNGDWTINAEAYEGNYCVKSGDISNNATSELIVTLDVLTDGEISFFKKVSSDDDDLLVFYIDDEEQGSWGGSAAWSEETFSVQRGTRTFKWSYEKDNYGDAGSDCAWIDYIVFPPVVESGDHVISLNVTEFDVITPLNTIVTRDLEITNTGAGTIEYRLRISDTTDGRNISGSYVECSATEFIPGETSTWTFTVFNASTDSEWLTDVNVEFPEGVIVNSSTDLTGGNSPLISDGTTGDGITLHWVDPDDGYGEIYGNETATAEVEVTISSGFYGDIELNYEIIGDEWGGDPHTVEGTIDITSLGDPITWITLSSQTGSVFRGDTEVIEVTFDTHDIDNATYSCDLILLDQNDVETIIPVTLSIGVDNDDPANMPSVTALKGNYPNPFNPTTYISFDLKENANVSLEIFNIKGQKVKTLRNEEMKAGSHSIKWSGKDNTNKSVSSGIYFYRLNAGNYKETRKMMLMK